MAHTRRERDVEREARRMVRAHGSGSVAIYDADGVLRQAWTYVAEREHLVRGKRFEEEVVKSWSARHGGTLVRDQHTVLLGWHRDLIAKAGEVPKGVKREKRTTGRLDILVDVDPTGTAVGDDLKHAYRAVLEVKSTQFDRMSLASIKRAIKKHREQIVAYIGTQLDLGTPDAFADEEAFVAPGVIYAYTPTDPTLRRFIEDYFGEECISVVWGGSAPSGGPRLKSAHARHTYHSRDDLQSRTRCN